MTDATRIGSKTREHSRAVLVPLGVLVAVELLTIGSLAWFGRFTLSVPVVITALGLALGGLVPALTRPNKRSVQLGMLLVLLAGNILSIAEQAVQNVPILGLGNVVGTSLVAVYVLAGRTKHRAQAYAGIVGGIVVTVILVAGTYGVANQQLAQAFYVWLNLWLIGVVVAAVAHLVSTQGGTGMMRWQLGPAARPIVITLLVASTPMLLQSIGPLLGVNIPIEWVLLAIVFVPLSVGYSVVRHDLFGIDAVLRRALVYTGLSAVLLALFFGVANVFSGLLAGVMPRFQFAAAAVGLVVLAVALEPLRRRMQALIDLFFYPEHQAFRQAMAEAHTLLDGVVGREAVVTLLTKTVPHHLGVSDAQLVFDTQAPPKQAKDGGWNAPLVHREQTLAQYWLGPRPTLPRYDAEEQAALGALLQQAALALAYIQTFDALATLNEELEERVAARTAQAVAHQQTIIELNMRQRLAQDLHDSVSQTVFSLGLSASAIRDLVTADPAAAVAALHTQEAMAQRAGTELRALLTQMRSKAEADDVRVALDQHLAALRDAHGFVVTLDAPATLHLPAAQATTVLAVIREALHNTLKHSGVAAAHVVVREQNGDVHTQIIDTGSGFVATEPATGFGLAGMHERIATVGGTLLIETAIGRGTMVSITIPRAI